MICSLLTYWTGLQKQEVATQAEHDAAVLKSVAQHFHQQVHKEGKSNMTISKLTNM
jgi:hypothetical protein